MRILITGSNGLLGQKITGQLIKANIPFLATSKGENRNVNCPDDMYRSMEITNEQEIDEVMGSFRPTHIIHTAAITNVDYCELHPEECRKVNVDAVELLFKAAEKYSVHFQLLSTDFVFDGLKGNYSEEDEVNPLSHYGRSKTDAENILLTSDYLNYSIVRTIIVYGVGSNLSRSNIVCWAKESLLNNQPLTIVDDQFRAPTWADDLAWACLEICKKEKHGIYHISGPETMSIYEIVERIATYYKCSTEQLKRSKSDELNQPASRPPKTGFDLTKAKNDLGYNPKTLEQTLDFI